MRNFSDRIKNKYGERYEKTQFSKTGNTDADICFGNIYNGIC